MEKWIGTLIVWKDFYNADAKFRDPVIVDINEAVGLHNWAIRFHPYFTGEYDAFIYCENDEQYHKIVSIIMDKLKHGNIRIYEKKGTVDDYIEGR